MKIVRFFKKLVFVAVIVVLVACLSFGLLTMSGCNASAKDSNNSANNPVITETEKIYEHRGNIMLRVAVDDLGSIAYYVETRTGVMYCTKGVDTGLEETYDPRTSKPLLYEDWVLYPTTYDKLYPVINS